MENINIVLADDLDLLKEQLEKFTGYDFATDLSARMKAIGINKNDLAKRAQVSHVAVVKWLNRVAKPRGKERFKELGMALGMNQSELNSFLLANNYPRLYAKNPLDGACRIILLKSAGKEGIVEEYRNLLLQHDLNAYALSDSPDEIHTSKLEDALEAVKSIDGLGNWLSENYIYLRSLNKNYIPHPVLIHFIMLYLGGQSINDKYVTGQMPVAVRNLLWPLIADKEIAVKGLRAKLVVYGLYENMNDAEIDQMLITAGLQPISEPLSKIDCVLLGALRYAHERYPYYDLNNAEKLLNTIHTSKCGEYVEFQEFYEDQRECAQEMVKYYESEGHRSKNDRLFEETYTDYSDSCILWYVRDILHQLVKDNILPKEDAEEYLSLMKTYEDMKGSKS
jgi:hypothetical protein